MILTLENIPPQAGTPDQAPASAPSAFEQIDCCGCGLPTSRILLFPFKVRGGNYPICCACRETGNHQRACDGCEAAFPERALLVDQRDGTTLCPACIREWLEEQPTAPAGEVIDLSARFQPRTVDASAGVSA